MPRDGYLTTAEVAARLHVGPSTVTRWARLGRLPHVRMLDGRLYPAEAIEKLAHDLMVGDQTTGTEPSDG